MYIAVCDDQIEEINSLTALLHKWQEEHHAFFHYKTFYNAADLLDSAEKERFSLYLLDVIMPGIDGMATAREIRSFDTAADIVFLTSSPSFAYESYGVRALEYLLKPITADLLFPLLDRLYLREQRPQEGLTLKTGVTLIRIPFSQLSFVEVNRKHLYFNLVNGQVKEVTGSMKDYEELLLSRTEFTRIHRSYIVNMLQIEELSPAGIRTFSGKNLPVSRLLYSQFQKEYMGLLFDRKKE
ncbi:MAG: LytTR family DNA-binding domain-containing protein [Lachnospiraceae bacterium]|nr:LytTR family DNA-binding domain-containing protein [Lachnospiraceae bacterium]